MLEGLLLYEPCVSAQDALAWAETLPDSLSETRPLALYGASLSGDLLALGRYQHARQVLGDPAAERGRPWIRRATGGVTLRVGEGVTYLALGLRDRSVLMPCPAGRLLNRNVRGVLAGLRHAGLQINYFGRDFLSCGADPVSYVAWDAREQGAVVLEFFFAHTRAWFVPEAELAYPPRREPALRGKLPTTIDRVQSALTPERLVQTIAEGHARSFGVSWSEAPTRPTPAAAQVAVPAQRTWTPEHRLVWSTPREEAIGYVSAGVCLDDSGKFAAVRIVGDFFAHRACPAKLETLLLGASPSAQTVGEAVDAAFTRSGYDVEGVRSLGVVRDAILDAAAVYGSSADVIRD